MLVTPEFLGTGYYNQTQLARGCRYRHLDDIQPEILHNLGRNSKNLTRLDNAACMQAYAGDWISEWRNVLLVTKMYSNNSILDIYASYHKYDLNDPSWLCSFVRGPAPRATKLCDLRSLAADSNNWRIQYWTWDGRPPRGNESYIVIGQNRYTVLSEPQIEYCLAEPTTPHCRISISTPLLIVVIIFNAIKFTCLVCTLLLRDFKPLITVGDAIASFLRSPDDKTRQCGLLSARNLRYKRSPDNEGKSDTLLYRPSAHLPKKWEWKCEWWFHGASTGRWLWCLLL